MKINKLKLVILLIGILLILGLVVAEYRESSPKYTQYRSYLPSSTNVKEYCNEGQDFIVQIAPFGCTTAVEQ